MSANELDARSATLKTIDGREKRFEDIIGKKPVYLKFWASWCIPCQEQMPHLQNAFDTYHRNIEILAINLNINDDPASVKRIQKEYGLTVPIVTDDGGVLAQAYKLVATPFHVLIGRNGKVVHVGHDANGELDAKLAVLASNAVDSLAEISVSQSDPERSVALAGDELTLWFFTSAWCNWYLKDSRPAMAARCVQAQQKVNGLAMKYPNVHWRGILTRMWTGEKELAEYREKYRIPFAVSIDSSNELFFAYHVDTLPTLVAVQGGKEIFRAKNFDDLAELATLLEQYGGTR